MRRNAFIAAAIVLLVSPASADDRAAVVAWEGRQGPGEADRYVPAFPKELAALDKTQVKLQGFMMPLEPAAKQKRFLLSALPSDCGFCMAAARTSWSRCRQAGARLRARADHAFPAGSSWCATTRAGCCTA